MQPTRAEKSHHTLAIGGASGSGIAVHLVRVFRSSTGDRFLPKNFAVLPIQTEDAAFLAVFRSTGEKEPITPVHGRRLPLPFERFFPDYRVLVPLDGHIPGGRMSAPGGTAELRPVVFRLQTGKPQ